MKARGLKHRIGKGDNDDRNSPDYEGDVIDGWTVTDMMVLRGPLFPEVVLLALERKIYFSRSYRLEKQTAWYRGDKEVEVGRDE